MRFDPVLADIRFGCGLSPIVPPPVSAAALLATLDSPDDAARAYPIEEFARFGERTLLRRDLVRARRAAEGKAARDAVNARLRDLSRVTREAQFRWMAHHFARRATTPAPFREKLAAFWADHFTATAPVGLARRATAPYIESAVRPHVSGQFEDLLIAAVTHPVMLLYLDQTQSVGPNSAQARRNKEKTLGLNENLAREVLELHTLGVDGPYGQDDVQALARLLTGLSYSPDNDMRFRARRAEPGVETFLGRRYGGAKPQLAHIETALRDLARHPATARHLAHKLAVHFVSDSPDRDLVAAIADAYSRTGGDLRACYAAMLAHPAAWAREGGNVKPPADFIGSALRALAIDGAALARKPHGFLRARLFQPLRLMGHPWEQPLGPDGLPEADSAWITPQGLAARLQWAVTVPGLLMSDLPDPRHFVVTALGADIPAGVRFAAGAAESRAAGIGLILASPAFQRM